MVGKPILTFVDDKVGGITYLIFCSIGTLLFLKVFLEMLDSSLLTNALKGHFGPIFLLSIPLLMIMLFLICSIVMFKRLFIDKSIKLYPEGFSFFDQISQSPVNMAWELLESVNLKATYSRHSTEHYMNVTDAFKLYQIELNCISRNPEDVSQRMKKIYQHWKNGDFSRSDFEVPFYPNKLNSSQLISSFLLITLFLFVIYWGIQNSDFTFTYEGNLYHFYGFSRFFLISAGVITLLNMLGRVIDHFDTRNNEIMYMYFNKYTGILGCFLFNISLITVLW